MQPATKPLVGLHRCQHPKRFWNVWPDRCFFVQSQQQSFQEATCLRAQQKTPGQLSLCSSLLSRLFRTTAPPPQQRLETSRAREECSALLSGIRGAAVAEAQHVAAPRLARSPAELCPGRGEFDSFMVSAGVFVTSTLIPSIETYLEPASCFRQTRNLL